MKKILILSLIILLNSYSFAQKKEKIKGSKIVTIQKRTVSEFQNIDVEDNIEIFLVKGDSASIIVEADENLHEFLKSEVSGNTLRLYTTRKITSSKKLSCTIKYTNSLKVINAKNTAIINALEDLELDDIAIKNNDFSKSFLNVKATNFTLLADDKCKIELNLKAEKAIINLSRNSQLKALVTTASLNLDMYLKATATIEGDTKELKLRLDNNTIFTGKKLIAYSVLLTTESYSTANIYASNTIEISAAGDSEIKLFGAAKVDLKSLTNNATIYKKEQ